MPTNHPTPSPAARARYYVRTRDYELEEWTPQRGVRTGPYSKWGLRKALRKLNAIGYDTTREGGVSVLVEREDMR